MATRNKLAVLLLLAGFTAAAREAPQERTHDSLESRLVIGLAEEGGSGLADCWWALLELRSCTNEIVLFFLNGEAYIGQECCRAIRIITHQCWPNMLTSLGFTAEEGDILRDYCVMRTTPPSSPSKPPLPSSPAPAPAT